MSYDITIGDFDSNMTSNISAVFYDHMNGGLPGLNGLTGRQALNEMAIFWRRVNETRCRMNINGARGEPEMCSKYDSPNGWGSLVGALVFAGEITAACGQHPRHRVHVHH